jgi:cytochrome c-type biogenesis protein CcmH/NrfG
VRDAQTHWEAALAVNGLDSDGWFAHGYALLKTKRYEASLAAFTRTAQLEPEHAQAWNNIAALCLRTERWRPGFKALQVRGGEGQRVRGG